MSLASTPSMPPKRPRLSLQTKTPTAHTLGKSATALKSDFDPSSPTAFNTLSNAYAAAIENASPRTARPLADSKSVTARRTPLRLETANVCGNSDYIHPSQRTQTPGPFSSIYPDTPSSALSSSVTLAAAQSQSQPQPQPESEPKRPFSFTPPQSAASEQPVPKIFTFASQDTTSSSPSTPRTPRRRLTFGSQTAPYTHPRALRSILRNSPLPPPSAMTPAALSRVSMRMANKASKKVGYNDPLTQTITTNKYVKSHIDLLVEDSPHSATDPEMENLEALDLTMAYTGDETRDGGQTPGPFEEMRRRMAESELENPGARKRRRREKKRRWEWTISTNETGEGDDAPDGRTPLTAVMRERTPITAIRSASISDSSEASEVEERCTPSGTGSGGGPGE
ncbi:uncharacterized protein L3040_000452 [Drepanopeziza brunnea f. sp. 'multigermtubi']|nr:hypothetical protein L3040_000452 [Drepanopeziza brunnea f. sp. 'multigermtubi']